MIFHTHPITTPLSQYIENIFYHQGYMPEHSKEKVVPTGHVFLIMELDGYERHTYDEAFNVTGTYTHMWISGAHNSHINISAHQNSEMLVIQFKPEGAYPFLKTPISQLSNAITQAEEYLGKVVLDIREQVINRESVTGKFEIIENWLTDLYDPNLAPPEELISTLSVLRSNPFSRHKELIEQYPKTQKHLINQFKKYCGLTPKEMHRIFRFNEVLATIHQKQKIQWTDIVYETGYSDQSHFIKEFQKFSGFNPSEYIDHKYNESIPNFFPLDKEG